MTAPMTPRVLVVGDVADDFVVMPLTEVTHASDTPAKIRHVPGGSAANVAAWLGHLGVPVTFVGRAGSTNAPWHVEQLRRHGVRALMSADPELATGTIVLLLDRHAERTMYVDRGANAALTGVPDEAWDDVDWLHLTGYSFFDPSVRPVAVALVKKAHEHGARVSVDPSSSAFLRDVGPTAFLTWTAGAHLVVPNVEEATTLTGLTDPEAAAERLARTYGHVVVKQGPAGAAMRTAGGAGNRIAAEAAEVVDSTGAGDAFAAGLIAAMRAGDDPSEALRAGAEAAARAVAVLGARPVS
jgi:sugar/nucleoside kinase (ribokinase family)